MDTCGPTGCAPCATQLDWELVPGTATDVAVGPDTSVWIIGTEYVRTTDLTILRLIGSDWSASEGGAVRIAVGPNGRPWVVNTAGEIYRRTSNSPTAGGWELLPGRASDIGVGADGSAWIIGVDSVGLGDHSVLKWVDHEWVAVDGGGRRISVDPIGCPWIVNAAREIYRRTTNDPGTGGWELLPGSARDIAVGADGSAWTIGIEPGGTGNDFSLQRWNASGQGQWLQANGRGIALSVDSEGRPWLINSQGGIFRAR